MEELKHSRKLAFIGMMGSGKSTLARLYADKVGGTALDTDAEFTRRYGDITAFFERFGEAEFRKREQELLIEAAQSDACAISTGGGSVLSKAGMNALRRTCDIVYLAAPLSVLKARIESSARPLKAHAEKLMKEREPLYKRYADYTVDSSGDALNALEQALKNPRPNRYDIVLSDSDDTLLDFAAAMRHGVVNSARAVGITSADEIIIKEYSRIIKIVWGMLERGEITHAELDILRFCMLRDALGENFEPDIMNKVYITEMQKTRFVLDGAVDFIRELKRRGIKTYIVTNSPTRIAKERLKALGGEEDGAYISEDVGFDKPDVRFFDAVLSDIGVVNKDRVLVFGDSLTSDIAGAINAGLDSCLYDPSRQKQSNADYTVADYSELLSII